MSNDVWKFVAIGTTAALAAAAAVYYATKEKQEPSESPDLGTIKSNTRGVYFVRKIFGVNVKVKLV
jgi:hypothetical protein